MRAVDLFAGAGGWSEGATQAGARVVAAVNHWPVAVASHAANHPETEHRCQDVALMDPRTLPAFELLLASPACQGHSRARGTEKPHHDALRSTMWAVVDVADVRRPRALLVENVPEVTDWTLYPHWRAALETLGYALTEHVLDASEFGVPQERRRFILTGVLDGAPLEIRSPRLPPIAAESFLDADGAWSPVLKRGRAAATLEKIEASRERLGARFLLPFYGSTKVGRSTLRPIGTVTTKDRYALVDGDRMRMLTVDENRRAMGFRDGYILTGTRADQVKQLGNAVCPPLAREVVRQVLTASRATARAA